MPTNIEPSRRFREGPQAKHVPRGQRGLGHGSFAVSYGATFILACLQRDATRKFPRPPVRFPVLLCLRLCGVAEQAAYQDRRGGVTADAKRDRAVGTAGCRRRPPTSRHAYVLVNNRAEGNAPLTVQGVSDMLRN